jgi:hypothetical protein
VTGIDYAGQHADFSQAGGPWIRYVEAFVRNIENKIEVTYINTSPGWPALSNGTVSTGDPRTDGAIERQILSAS